MKQINLRGVVQLVEPRKVFKAVKNRSVCMKKDAEGDGNLYRADLVLKMSTEERGIDYDEVLSRMRGALL